MLRIFISYARVDQPYCTQIAEMLDIHTVWYDSRLYGGQNWWREILRRLDWCDTFIYLLSEDSVTSDYCLREFAIAQKLKKKILPVLIKSDAVPHLPPQLQKIQYANLTNGLTMSAVKILLNALFELENELSEPSVPMRQLDRHDLRPASIFGKHYTPTTVIGKAADAMDNGKFDQAYFLINQMIEKGHQSSFYDLNELLIVAKQGLERQTREREIEIEYKTIAELIRHKRTRRLGCQALQAFVRAYPGRDSMNLRHICMGRMVPAPATEITSSPPPITRDAAGQQPARGTAPAPVAPPRPRFALPMLEWCLIPAGTTFEIASDTFQIAKYPVTNAQYEIFLDDQRGYGNQRWWEFSRYALQWFRGNPQGRDPYFSGDLLPRENVNWYEAMAFCNWLSARTGWTITLPTQGQWRRAAAGDQNLNYPWGNDFRRGLANIREDQRRRTTPVDAFPAGASPYGVFDMTGNVWEWCLNADGDAPDFASDLGAHFSRALQGGSWWTTYKRVHNLFNFYTLPEHYYSTSGFRVVRLR